MKTALAAAQQSSFLDTAAFPIIIAVIAIIAVLAILASGYVKAPPDQAYIISGLKKESKILIGRAGIKIPFLERMDKLYLGQMTVDIKTEQSVPTNDFINVNVDAVAKVRINPTTDGIKLAAKNFLNKKPGDIALDLQDSLQGNMREIIGTLSLKVINTDRDSFSDQVMMKASKDMDKLGIEILSCNIQNVTDENGNVVWNSGKKASDQSVLIPYEGETLADEMLYKVEVSVADNHGNVEAIEGTFETGIFDNTEFTAKMITSDFPEEETACPVFGKTFAIDKKVKKARLYATAHGVYEVTLNGQTVGDCRMAPGWTSYHNRLQYQIYDITEMLAADNKIEITVGNGWYKGILGFYCQPNQYGTQVGAFAEIHVEYEDGSKEVIATDETWSVKTGEIRYSEIYMGETIDTDAPEITEGNVVVKEFDKAVLTAQENEPVRITEKIEGKELIVTPKGEKLVDFGQIITGVVEVHVKGEKGQKIVIRHAEVLDKDGNFYPETLRQAKSIDTFICNGEEQIFRPHFTFHGFRYICVEGMEEFTADQFVACVTHSDMEKTGDFPCSNIKVNKLQSNIIWSQRDNFLIFHGLWR